MSETKRAPRRDATRRREALILAAAAAFEEQGYGVAMETIAERAGVGRATLYRNFKDREALALAIFAREIDRMEAMIDPARPIAQTIGAMVREGARASGLFARIALELHVDAENIAAFRALGERLERVVTPAVMAAQARGELSATATAREVVLAVRMLGGLLRPQLAEDEGEAQRATALAMLMRGLMPRGSSSCPSPSGEG
ncbi:TetR/AcrR family transcriptional regulator [Sphingomonas adhaesiva]|uniref:TetR/AcrR family transcriptional regulator n=1 Tax=Sphingomonas adhaesiva TaxID=28212 RepID=UPI002FFB4964